MSAGKFADAVAGGRVFSISTVAAGLAIPVSTATAPSVLLWNPMDSGVRLNLLRYVFANTSDAISAAGGVGFQTFNVGSSGITGLTNAALGAIAASKIENALIGSGALPKAKASAAGTNAIVAVVAFQTIGVSVYEPTTTAVLGTSVTYYDFDGLLQLSPGWACFPCESVNGSGALFQQTLFWEEVPLA